MDGGEDDGLLGFHSLPGHLIRRCRQRSNTSFTEACRDFNVTPIQYAVLTVLSLLPGIDQNGLGEQAGLDASTTSEVLQRLEARGLVQRENRGKHQGARLTEAGQALHETMKPAVAMAQHLLLEPLSARERTQLLRLLSKLAGVSTTFYTVPRRRRRSRVTLPAA